MLTSDDNKFLAELLQTRHSEEFFGVTRGGDRVTLKEIKYSVCLGKDEYLWSSKSEIGQFVYATDKAGHVYPGYKISPGPYDVVAIERRIPGDTIPGIDNAAKVETCETFETGAKRGTDTNGLRYDLISPVVLMSMAGIFAEGAAKYGDHNYQKGLKISNLFSHALNHLCMFMLGDTSEPHLTHAAWNINAMIHFMAIKPEMDDRYKYDLTPEQIQQIKAMLAFNPPKGEIDVTGTRSTKPAS